MQRSACILAATFLAAVVLSTRAPVTAQQLDLDPAIAARGGQALTGYRVAEPDLQPRGALSDLYRRTVRNVTVVVSADGMGSSVVIGVNQNRQAWVITNHHVVEKPFTVNGRPTVLLVFYDPALKNETFDGQRFTGCLATSRDQSDWCQAVRQSTRQATVMNMDASRDLALLAVSAVPSGVAGFQAAEIQALQPGDDVAVIGHPKGLLWSLTTGIISAVRTRMPVGSGFATVIQTQAPVNPGNSGGPLIGSDGSLAGVIFGARIGERLQMGKEEVGIAAPGLNLAVGIDEVLTFVRTSSAR